MKELIKFVKNNYIILIPICLIVVLILIFSIYKIQKLYNNFTKEYEYDGYTYYAGRKINDSFIVKSNRKKEIIDIKTNKRLDLDDVIYSSKIDEVIFVNDMSILFVHDNYSQYKVGKNASLHYDSNNTKYVLKSIGYEDEVSNFVLYDGYDMYFFSEDSVLTIGKKTYNLSKMSYVICNNGNSVEFYDKESDKYSIIDISNEEVRVSSNSYNIKLNEDKAIRFNDFVLLTKPKYLDNIKKK